MLPESLVSIYQQYKKDTDSVASWLASTAKKYGYSSDLLTAGNTQQRPGVSVRLKGKARKEAKKQGKTSASAAPTLNKYIIAIQDFVPLAEFICASQKPIVSVPDVFSETLNRVISVRSNFGSQLGDEGAAKDEDSDLKHSYFVGILEKVQEVLRPRMSAKAEKPTSRTDGGKDEDSVSRFSSLQLYEPSQEFLDAPNIERPSNASGDDTVYEAEPQNSFEEAIFAFGLMMDDINRIRSYIKWIWSNYRDGVFDLAAAAVATNTGIDLARNLIDQVVPLCKPHGGACKIAQKCFYIQAMVKGFTTDDISGFNNGKIDNTLYDIANNAFFTANHLLLSFAKVLSPKQIPIYREGMFGTYDPESDRSRKTGRQKFNEDKVILGEIFSEAITLARMVPNYPVEDEFIRGLRELDKTGDLPFYAVYAAQILLDVHHTIRNRAADALNTVIMQISNIKVHMKSHLEFHKDLKIDNWPASNDRMLVGFQKSVEWFLKDPVYVAKMKVAQQHGQQVSDSIQQYRILKHSPILSGLVLYHFRAQMYDIGIAVANAWGSITYSNHLYNALLQEKLLEGRRWKDMDITETLLGESNFFVGGKPQDPEGYHKRFLLQMGASASVLTNRSNHLKRGGTMKLQDIASRAGPRGIKDGAPVSSMFMERYVRNTNQVEWTPEHIDDIISRSRYQEEESEEDGTLILGQIEDPEKLKQKNRNKGVSGKLKQRKKVSEGALLPPERLVRSLALALTAESLEFGFPYLLMHRWCWKVLRAVKTCCDPILRRTIGPAYIERESELPFVVGYVFMSLSDTGGHGPDNELMGGAAHAFKEMLDAKAGELVVNVCRQAYDLQVEFDEEDEDEEEDGSDDIPELSEADLKRLLASSGNI